MLTQALLDRIPTELGKIMCVKNDFALIQDPIGVFHLWNIPECKGAGTYKTIQETYNATE